MMALEYDEKLMTICSIKVFTLTNLSSEPEFQFTIGIAGSKDRIQVYMSVLQDGEIMTRMYPSGINFTLEREVKDLLDIKLQRVILGLIPLLDFENNEARPICSN